MTTWATRFPIASASPMRFAASKPVVTAGLAWRWELAPVPWPGTGTGTARPNSRAVVATPVAPLAPVTA